MEFTEKGEKVFEGRTPVPMATRLLKITSDKKRTGDARFKIVKNYAFDRAFEACASINK